MNGRKIVARRSNYHFEGFTEKEASEVVELWETGHLEKVQQKWDLFNWDSCPICGAFIVSNKRITGCIICNHSFVE
ncbi:MAG: hypothetical protein ACTSSF_00325 [Candidatus Heimdallarchaeaceae archaeon]